MDQLKLTFGNFIILGLQDTKLNDTDKKLLEEYQPSGIILFARNFSQKKRYNEWINDLAILLEEIYKSSSREKLLITIDHEGGNIVRTPPPITRFPYAAFYGDRAYDIGKATASELISLGINTSYAPVADIDSNPLNPVIGKRAFGTAPEETALYAADYYRGLSSEGVLGCAKHFPGHGDTNQDSHFELPRLDLTLDELRIRELIPFQRLIECQIEMIMTAHILFPKIDPSNPATLSKLLLTDLLRNELGYEGIIVADDISMLAVNTIFEYERGIVRSFQAGCDMFIVPINPLGKKRAAGSILERDDDGIYLKNLEKIAKEFYEAIQQEEIDKSKYESSIQRIEKILDKTQKLTPKMLEIQKLIDAYRLGLELR
jgi:beta-N-acetylhexosaminidase